MESTSTPPSSLLDDFFVNGFVVVPNGVSDTQCNAALRLVNRSLGTAVSEGRDKMIWTDTEITSLFNNSPLVRNCVGTLLGNANSVPYIPAAQIALRFPGTLCLPETFEPVPFWKSFWHIDGLPSSENGISLGQIKNFTLLVGVCLQDVLEDLHGNFVVFPRSHHVMEKYFRDVGFEDAKKGLTNLPALPLAEPVQVKLRKGDFLIAHYMTCHSIAPNIGHQIRYMAYFRVNMRNDAFHPEPMLNIWLDLNPAFVGKRPPLIEGSGLRSAGYIDQKAKQELASRMEMDRQMQEDARAADALFNAQRWGECAPLMGRLSDAKPNDVFLLLKAGICESASTKDLFQSGQRRLERLIQISPQFAQGYVVLARNLQRQYAECVKQDLKQPAIENAVKGLLQVSPAADVAVEAIKVLRDLDFDRLEEVAAAAAKRYPALSNEIAEAKRRDKSFLLWNEAKAWMATPDPKDLKRGLALFTELVSVAPNDYWAHILLGSCQFWSNLKPQAVETLRRAQQLDATFPHSYCVLAFVFSQLGRKEEAVAQVELMLTRNDIKCLEPDHFKQVKDGVQVCCNIVDGDRYAQIVQSAKSKFPSIADELGAIRPQKQEGCVMQ